ncbi:hypothetical protein [Spiroplasma melliferum]|uniref:Membrane protein n=2 Tax=Spiroplasma melliferum TaxID=2134 RepID=A0AAI9X0U8_SPIME|nr:hypothetical protein [Spiroplasma melliferum]ELL44160.1 putative transmembrane protein [Spiroplasma melliferum IPMB4A]KAI92290.1 membrane protein [Spiroplasma melliferum KC3]QCO23722.1 hypothetical protein SRED_002196 [Spiroplasma melliferum]
MGFFWGLLGTIGIISNTTATATAPAVIETLPSPSPNIIVKILLDRLQDCFNRNLSGAEEIMQSLARYLKVALPENLSSSEIIEYFGTAALSSTTEATVEGGILAGTFGTAVETLGISLLIGAAIYGGYYTYTHWDNIKTSIFNSIN